MVPRLRTTAIAGLAVSAILVTSGVAYAHDLGQSKVAGESSSSASRMSWVYYSGELTDFTTTPDVFKGAKATAMMITVGDSSYFRVRLYGLDKSAIGNSYGPQLHAEYFDK